MFDMPFVIFDQRLCVQTFYFTFFLCPPHDLFYFRSSKGFTVFLFSFFFFKEELHVKGFSY